MSIFGIEYFKRGPRDKRREKRGRGVTPGGQGSLQLFRLGTFWGIVQQVYLKGSAFLLSAGPQGQHPFQSQQRYPQTGPPPPPPAAASRPFANEGTAAGYWETDGPPHLNGFDLAALSQQVQAWPVLLKLRSGEGTDS